MLFNFEIKHIPGKEMGFTDLLSRLPSRKALPTSQYGKKFAVATFNKILENFVVKSDRKKKNCIKNDFSIDNPVVVYSVNSFNNLDCVKPIAGKKRKALTHPTVFLRKYS